MRTLTTNEIGRTAFRYIPGKWESQFGYTSNRDKNEMCAYCKNENTDVVRDDAYNAPFAEFYGDRVKTYTVVHCYCCSAVWSFFVPKTD
jgi:hypothetical protein